MSLRTVDVNAPGKSLQAIATLVGEPGVQVRFQTHDVTPYVTTIVATTDSDGVARASIPVTHSGYITATALATGVLPLASLSSFYEVPAGLTLSSARPVSSAGSVRVYHRPSDVHLIAHSRPIGLNHVRVQLYRKISGKWVLRLDQSLKTNALGDVTVHLPKLLKKHVYREVIFVGPTAKNAASPKQTFTFEIR